MARTALKLPSKKLSDAIDTALKKVDQSLVCTVKGKYIKVLGYRNELAERGPFDKGSFVKILDIYPNIFIKGTPKTDKDFFCDASGLALNGDTLYYQFFLDELDLDSITDTNPNEDNTMAKAQKAETTKQELIVDTALVGEVTNPTSLTDRCLREPDVEATLRNLLQERGASKVAVAALCTFIYEHPEVYKEKGYGDFITYTNETFGMERRSAYQLVQVYKACRDAGISNENLEALGYSKMLPIVQAYGKDYAAIVELVDMALAHNWSHSQICGRIRQLAALNAPTDAGDNITDGTVETPAQIVARSKLFEFTLYDARADELEEIVRRTALSLESQGLPHAMGDVFYHVFQQYLLGLENVDRTLEFDLQIIEARYGVKVGVLEETSTQTTPQSE